MNCTNVGAESLRTVQRDSQCVRHVRPRTSEDTNVPYCTYVAACRGQIAQWMASPPRPCLARCCAELVCASVWLLRSVRTPAHLFRCACLHCTWHARLCVCKPSVAVCALTPLPLAGDLPGLCGDCCTNCSGGQGRHILRSRTVTSGRHIRHPLSNMV